MLDYIIKGIDVSEWQGYDVNFEDVKEQGYSFVMLRAGYGKQTVDGMFRRNMSKAIKAGLDIGAYWFIYARNEEEAIKNAECFAKTLREYWGHVNYPVACDFEYDSVSWLKNNGINPTREVCTAIVRAFCKRMEELGYYCMNYSNLDYIQNYFGNLSEFDLWLAEWGVRNPDVRCGIWQYTDAERVAGISGGVDANIAYQDYPKIIREAGLNFLSNEAKEEKKEEKKPAETPTPTVEKVVYTVKAGDTLSRIANEYGLTYQEIANENKLSNPNLIYVGQKLTIPAYKKKEESEPEKVYTVRAGDTLSAIAAKFGTTVAELVKKNGIANPNLIYVGQMIKY